jgi:hypothetical protein
MASYPRTSLKCSAEKAMIGLTILRTSVNEIEKLRDAPGEMVADEYEAVLQLRETLKALEMLVLTIGVYADSRPPA